MAIRWIVGIVGALIALLGLSQVILAKWWLSILGTVLSPAWFGLWAAVAVAFGVVLITAYAGRQVGLRVFVLVLGIYAIIGGLLMAVAPGLMRDLLAVVILDRARNEQMIVMWVAGIIRICLGGALLYAAARCPRNESSAA